MEDEKQEIPSAMKVAQLMAAIWTVANLINWWRSKKSKSEKLSKKEQKILGKTTGAPTTKKPGAGPTRL